MPCFLYLFALFQCGELIPLNSHMHCCCICQKGAKILKPSEFQSATTQSWPGPLFPVFRSFVCRSAFLASSPSHFVTTPKCYFFELPPITQCMTFSCVWIILDTWFLPRSIMFGRKGCVVVANDLNPDAVLFAKRNAELHLAFFRCSSDVDW